jgi:hypothetical protein
MARTTIRLLLVLTLLLVGPALGPATTAVTASNADVVSTQDNRLEASWADMPHLSYRFDRQHDLVWCRLSLFARPDAEVFSFSMAIDLGRVGREVMHWWERTHASR